MKDKIHFFISNLSDAPAFKGVCTFKILRVQSWLNGCLVVWPNKQILSVPLTYCILLVKDQSTFYEIHSLATVFPLISAGSQISAAPLGIHIEISTSL